MMSADGTWWLWTAISISWVSTGITIVSLILGLYPNDFPILTARLWCCNRQKKPRLHCNSFFLFPNKILGPSGEGWQTHREAIVCNFDLILSLWGSWGLSKLWCNLFIVMYWPLKTCFSFHIFPILMNADNLQRIPHDRLFFLHISQCVLIIVWW